MVALRELKGLKNDAMVAVFVLDSSFSGLLLVFGKLVIFLNNVLFSCTGLGYLCSLCASPMLTLVCNLSVYVHQCRHCSFECRVRVFIFC